MTDISPTIYFLPGLGSSAAAFSDLIARPELTRFNCITLDYAGMGRRVNELPSGDALMFAAREVIADADRRSISEFSVVGHSMGSVAALLVAKIAERRITGFVSIEGNKTGQQKVVASKKIAAALEHEETAAVVREIVQAHRSSVNESFRRWSKDLEAVEPETLKRYARSLLMHMYHGQLLQSFNDLRCPKKFFYGDNYVGIPLIDQLQYGSTRYFQGALHFVMQDQPRECARAIESLFEKKQGNLLTPEA